MVEQLLNHIYAHQLCKATDKILLGVSGGLDSVVMLHLFFQAGFSIGVAHCNFQLRGEEADGDEEFVRRLCSEFNIPFYCQRFETKTFAHEERLSVQMAARELRYRFFEQIREREGYDHIATAHHLDDSLETALLNLARGSGLEGMAGIPDVSGKVIRPMLFATRRMLSEYASQHHLQWREDVTNQAEDYSRNYLRHQVVPKLKKLNPNLEETYRHTRQRLSEARQLALYAIKYFKALYVKHDNNCMIIEREGLLRSGAGATLLWELIKKEGFNFSQCRDILQHHQPGKYFFSDTHYLVVDRGTYILYPKEDDAFFSREIARNETQVFHAGVFLSLEEVSREAFVLEKNAWVAQLDADLLRYPLIWRTWKTGDYFVPLGMKHTKKVSDFLIDLKVSLPEKKRVTVIESGGEIAWVAGYRISEKFKVTEQTKRVLRIRYSKPE